MSEGKYKLKKLIKMLGDIKGRHTELVSVYVPTGYSLHEITNQLRQEQGTAENIKSKTVRKNVTTSLEKIMRHLQLYKKTPEHGLALFCGNISKTDKADIELFAIEPPDPIKVKLYWCDQRFVLDPLMDMIKEKEIYGIICLDKSEADIGLLSGKKVESLVHFESIVPGKTRAGGQSSARFARVREGLLNDWLKQVAEAANKAFAEREIIGILLSGPGPIKEILLKDRYLQDRVEKKILGMVDTSYTGEHGLHETIEKGESLLKEASVIKEKKILQKFFDELQKPHGLVAYGLKEVIDALESGAVDTVIISEDTTSKEIELECQCGTKKEFVTKEVKEICERCNQVMQKLGERDIIEAFEEKVKQYSSKLEVVSSETREGRQFFELGGIGAILRYRI
jgi:peptide chain release factor subunit 1